MALDITNWELMIDTEIDKVAKQRKSLCYERTIDLQPGTTLDESSLTAEGWSVKKKTKKKAYLEKTKPQSDLFEDEVWLLFYKMGFTTLNKDNHFAVVYSDNNGKTLSKQIDVLAIDENVGVLIECKCATVTGTVPNFRKDINEIIGIREQIFNAVSKQYPNRKLIYIFATKGYTLGEQDKNRLRDSNIIHFDDATMLYYNSLATELGNATKYQLLGSLFAGKEIEGLDCKIPAIKGKIQNGLVYYTFIIQPAKLLKIGYILHRTNANNDYEDLLPSYQRIIKKDRLKSVRKFVENGGYFPNSLIVSIDSEGPLLFEPVGSGAEQYEMGYLNLPKKYQSVYVIDGQHRLYGYADSEKAYTETVPVVAFENLDKSEQLRLFMEINENQKSVPKALRNILFIDINYDSENPKERQDALLGKIAKRLGEDRNSPLFQRVVIGEDASTENCCVTIDYIKDGLKYTGLFHEYHGNSLKKTGIINKDTNDELFAYAYPIIREYLNIIKSNLEQEWIEAGSWIVKNTVIYALLAVLGDILRITVVNKGIPFSNSSDAISRISKLSNNFAHVIGKLEPEKRKTIKNTLGGAAKNTIFHLLEMTFYEEYPDDFSDEIIINYYQTCYQNYADSAATEIKQITAKLIDDAKEMIDGPNWIMQYMSLEKANALVQKKASEQLKAAYSGAENNISEWEVMTLSDVVGLYGERSNWSEKFGSYFRNLGYQDTKLEMLSKLKSIVDSDSRIKNGGQIKKAEYDTVHTLYVALFKESE